MTPESITLAHRLGFHAMTRHAMAEHCRGMLAKCLPYSFAAIEPHRTYLYRTAGNNGGSMVRVREVTPKRTQAVVLIGDNDRPVRIHAGTWRGDFLELTPDLIALADADHREIVAAAVQAGLDVPPLVRREYPDLFVAVPERFAIPDHTASEKKATAADRLRDALSDSYFYRPRAIGVREVDEWIEEAHKRIAVHHIHAAMLVNANPDTLPDLDRSLAEQWANIDFYRWLRPLLDAGAVFHIERKNESAHSDS